MRDTPGLASLESAPFSSEASPKSVTWARPSPRTRTLSVEVAVHDAGLVRRREAPPCLRKDAQHITGAAALRAQPGPHGAAIDELERHEPLAFPAASIEDGDDVGVREARERLRFSKEPCLVFVGRRRGLQQLQRHLSIELGIPGGEDLAHGSGPDAFEHDVPAEGVSDGEGRGSGASLQPERDGLTTGRTFVEVPFGGVEHRLRELPTHQRQQRVVVEAGHGVLVGARSTWALGRAFSSRCTGPCRCCT